MFKTTRLGAAISTSQSEYSQSHLQGDLIEYPASTDVDIPVCDHNGPDTPMRPSTHRTGAPMPTVLEVKRQLKREFYHSGETELQDLHASAIFPSTLFTPRRIERYLAKTSLFDSEGGRWKDIPKSTSQEESLYKPFRNIVADILTHFQIVGADVLDTHKTWLTSLEEYQMKFVNEKGNEVLGKSSPDLCIMGSGTLFKRKEEDTPSYFFCVSPVELKTEKLLSKVGFHEVMLQIAVYARQCFNHQPNRRFVCSIMATEANFRLLIFDRVGVIWTRAFNIHDDAAAFVRTVLGVSNFTNTQYGCFDTAIKWLDCDKHCINQYLGMTLRHMEPVVQGQGVGAISIVVNSKPFIRKAIRGRGTRCWYGITTDNDHSPVVIKDSWRSVGRNAESDLLKRVANMDGVGKMLYYSKDDGDSVSKFRKLILGDLGANSFDRIFSRVVLEAYGPPIHHFESPMQLLCALRDAVAGHGFLWEQGILHRDVSVQNIVLGRQDAEDGNKGVLIDLDMAIDVHNYDKSKDSRTGTRTFQSVMVLAPVAEGEIRPPQDHLDDLESFYYVFMWICMLFVAPGKMAAKVSDVRLLRMEDPDNVTCVGAKQLLLGAPLSGLTPWISESAIFNELLEELSVFLKGEVEKKSAIKLNHMSKRKKKDVPTSFSALEVVHKTYKQTHHQIFLKHLNNAISQLVADESEGPNADLHPYDQEVRYLDMSACDVPLANSEASYGILKRGRSENEEEGDENGTGPEESATAAIKRLRFEESDAPAE